MSTAIPYADEAWNIVDGCTPAGSGCAHCWASRWAKRMHGMGQDRFAGLTAPSGDWNGTVRVREDLLDKPRHWRRPRRVFVCSMADLFHKDVPDDFLHRAFDVMERCSDQHTYLLLTKRPYRMREYLCWRWGEGRIPCRNIWPGFSAWDQRSFDSGWGEMREIPSQSLWVSLEPLLGPVNLGWCDWCGGFGAGCHDCYDPGSGLSWVVAGGESGAGFRPDEGWWYASLREQCWAAGVAFWAKQRAGVREGIPLLIDGSEVKEWPK